jgi:hypothetical protein
MSANIFADIVRQPAAGTKPPVELGHHLHGDASLMIPD